MSNHSSFINTFRTSGNRLTFALGLLSASIIAYQLVLMQLISIMQWYHFAYMIISIAMLGFGAAGTTLALFRQKLLDASAWLIPVLMALCGMFMILAFQLARLEIFQFDVYIMFVERAQVWILAANYLIYFLPFYLGALAIGILLTRHASQIGSYYFANLVGSGAGGVLIVIVLSWFFAIDALPLAAALAVLSAVIAFYPQKRKFFQISVMAGSALWLILSMVQPGEVPLSQYKSLSRTLLLPEAEIIYSKPDIHGRIDVVSSPALRYAPGISFGFTGDVPVKKNVFTNGEFYGVVPLFDTTRANIHNYTTENLPFVMGERNRVLIPDAATGTAIAHALQSGAGHVTAVTSIRTVKRLMQNQLADALSHLFAHPAVDVVYQDGRQFLFGIPTGTVYDAIILPRLESFGGSTGLNAIAENYLLTLEAMEQMWDRLTDTGVLAVTSWMDYPPRTTLKIAATILQTLERKGIDQPLDHIVAVRSWGTVTFVLSKAPLDSTIISNIRGFSERMMFDLVLLPGITPEERNRFNLLEDQSFLNFIDILASADKTSFVRDYDFHLSPATDDKPYFNRFIKPLRIGKLIREIDQDQLPFLELGYLIVWITLTQGGLIAAIFILLPLLRLRTTSKGKLSTVLYFAGLGLGYMFVEIILIQRFILYFGHPMYAISAVISTMMIASGAGSLYSGRFEAARMSVVATILVVLLLVIYTFTLTPMLMTTIHFPLVVKMILAFVLLAVPSFFMGMPFPSGIRVLNAGKQDQIPWAWGINGSLSVIATALATLIAVEFGFRVVMLSAVVFYLVAFGVAFFTFARRNITA